MQINPLLFSSRAYFLQKFPNPLEHERDVHESGIEDPQTPKLLRFAHRQLVYHVVFPTVTCSLPNEA
jgi:hypothetical protein